jgi:hypothetical protein
MPWHAVPCCAAEDFTCMTDFLETAAQAVADVDNCKVRPDATRDRAKILMHCSMCGWLQQVHSYTPVGLSAIMMCNQGARCAVRDVSTSLHHSQQNQFASQTEASLTVFSGIVVLPSSSRMLPSLCWLVLS